MKILISAILAALGTSSVAQAQDAVVEGPGYQVTEGTVLHPSVGMETGVISNVFYTEADPVVSPVLRLLAKFAFASRPEVRLENEGAEAKPSAPGLDFRAGVNFQYNEFLTSNTATQAQRDVAIGANLHLGILPKGTVAFLIDDHFARTTRPTNFESSQGLDRDVNKLTAQIKYQPSGRSISAKLRYENKIDVFESSSSSFANRMMNTGGLRIDWQFLPITRFYLDGSYGLISGLGDEASSYKVNSTPLRLQAGSDTAITENTTIRTRAGYGFGFYSGGADFSGVLFALEFGYRYSPLGRVTIEYTRDFQDSINANYYAEHLVRFGVDQQIDKVTIGLAAAAHLRGYYSVNARVGGADTRDDLIVRTELSAAYVIRDWLALTGHVGTGIVQTDYRSMVSGVVDDPSFTRHEAMAGLSAAF